MPRSTRRSRLTTDWLAFHRHGPDELRIEADWAGDRKVLAASLTSNLGPNKINAVLAGHLPLRQLFSPAQRRFLAECADTNAEPDALQILGPVHAMRWPPTRWHALDVTAERWHLTSTTHEPLNLLELSLRVEPQGAEIAQRSLDACLSRNGLDPATARKDAQPEDRAARTDTPAPTAARGRPHVVFTVTIANGRITAIESVADPSGYPTSTRRSSLAEKPDRVRIAGRLSRRVRDTTRPCRRRGCGGPPARDRHVDRTAAAAQVGVIADVVADDRLFAMWWLIALRGLRRGEAAGLRWVDVDLDQKIIMIEQQRLAYGHTVAIGPPKTAASRRTIALDRITVRLLRTHLRRQ